jgi:hypothetical protein
MPSVQYSRANRIDLVPALVGFLARKVEDGKITDHKFDHKNDALLYVEQQQARLARVASQR